MRDAVPLSRRSLLATGAAAATLPFASAAQAQSEPLRIGAVLPIAGAALPSARINLRSVGEAARMGLILGEEDAARNGELVGWTTVVTISNAPGVDAAARAARRLVEREKVSVIIGGFGREEAETLAGIAEESGSLFLNIAADSLRRACHANTFHVEASAAMYLDAIFGWFVRAGFRRWYFVHDDSADSQALYERALESLRDGHWGAEAAGRGMLRQDDSRDFAPVIADVGAAGPDVVLLLTDWVTQLDFLSRFEVSGLTQPVSGFPDAAAQMREF
jgi:branched-chain amino acid transport system substrate-binding protein